MKICGSCLEEMYFVSSASTPFEHSTILSRAVDLTDSWNDDAMAGINMSKVLPSFDIICARVFPWELFALWTD